MFFALATHCPGQTAVARERVIKAAYILKFPMYVTWPNEAFTNTTSPLVIGVLADGSMSRVLETHKPSAAKVKGHPVVVLHFDSLDDYQPCHLLFVSQSVNHATQMEVISQTRRLPVLVVGEKNGFATAGGVVNFYIDVDRTVGFEINRNALVERKLQVDARLLRLAKVVTTQPSNGSIRK